MRRVVALLLVALVSATVPLGQIASAAEPEAPPAVESAAPSPSVPPEAPATTDVEPPSGETAVPPLAAEADLTTTIVNFNNGAATIPIGQSLTLYPYMYPNPDGGTFSILVDDVVITTMPAAAGGISYVWTPTQVKAVIVTLAFSGTATLAPDVSDPLAIDVVPPYPTSVVGSAPGTTVRNTSVQLSATVTPDPGTGTVEFWDGAELLGSGSLVAGIATITTSFSDVRLHSLHARFTGNADWSARTSDFFYINVAGDGIGLTLTVPPETIAGPVTATATLSTDPGGGTIQWGWNDYQYDHSVDVGAGGVTSLDLGTLTPGTYHLFARFLGFGTSGIAYADLWFTAYLTTSTMLATNRTTATVGELPVLLTATVTSGFEFGGTVTFVDVVGGISVDLATVAAGQYDGKASFSSSTLRIGTHTIRARYNPTTGRLASVSDPITVVVSKDTAVHATFTPSLTAFYPYSDGFKDTVSLGGVLDEKATVTIRVYNSSGTLKRAWSLGTKVGKYAATWNGRTSTGANLPAGKYTLKASFKDLRGNTRTITAYSTLSWRQAVWKTTTLVRYADQLAYYADAPDGRLFYSPDYTRGRTMFTNYIDRDCEPDCAWISGLGSFALNTTAVGYRSLRITMQGHGYVDYNTGTIWLIRPTNGTWEYPSSLPEYLNTTNYGVVVPSAYYATKKLSFAVHMTEMMGEAYDLHYLKLTYQYAVWR